MSYNEYNSNSNSNSNNNDEYSSTGRQGGLNDGTTGSGAYGNQDSSYGSDNLSSGQGRDQYNNESSNYGSENRRDDIADRGTLGRDEYSGGNSGVTGDSGLGRDEYSSTSGRDNYNSNTGSSGFGSSRGDEAAGLTGSDSLHQYTSPGDRIGEDDLKPAHGNERDTHHSTGGNYASPDTEFGSGTTGGAGYGNKTSSSREGLDSSNTRFDSSAGTDAYSGSTDFGSGTTGGAGYGNKSTSGRDDFGDSSDTRFGSASETGAYSGSNEYGSGTTGGAGYGNKSSATGKQGDSTMGKVMEGLGKMTKNEKMVEKGAAKREAAGADDRTDY